jgi:putative ABC transport system permease protein
MKAYDVLDLARRNLRESILRNTLTTLGIAVGVASLVAMLSLGVGLQQMFNRRLTQSGLFDTVVVTPKRDFDFPRAFGRRDQAAAAESRALDDAAREQIERLPNVVEAFPDIRFVTEIRYQGKPHTASVSGIPASARKNDAFEQMQGGFFSSPQADEAILLADYAKALEPDPRNLIGKTIVLRYAERQALNGSGPNPAENGEDLWGFSLVRREKPLRVVGVVEREPYAGMRGAPRAAMFLPMVLAESLNAVQPADLRGMMRGDEAAAKKTYESLTVRATSPIQVQALEDAVKQMGFSALSVLDWAQNLRRVFAVVDLLLGIFGSLALAVASLGIINTLVMAILERRREIGIMKAVGASDADVSRLFFAEAGAMGALGGAAGVLLGWVMGRVINFGTSVYLRHQGVPSENVWSVPWWLVLGGIAFAIVVTLLSGLYPAARAAKLDPVQALRYE